MPGGGPGANPAIGGVTVVPQVWRRDFVKGDPGTTPFPSQVGAPSPNVVAVPIGTALPASTGLPVGYLFTLSNPLANTLTPYIWDGKRWWKGAGLTPA